MSGGFDLVTTILTTSGICQENSGYSTEGKGVKHGCVNRLSTLSEERGCNVWDFRARFAFYYALYE